VRAQTGRARGGGKTAGTKLNWGRPEPGAAYADNVGPVELSERYAATGERDVYLAGKKHYEQALAGSPDDPELHISYGYLLAAHARNQLRQAVEQFERATALDPDNTTGDSRTT